MTIVNTHTPMSARALRTRTHRHTQSLPQKLFSSTISLLSLSFFLFLFSVFFFAQFQWMMKSVCYSFIVVIIILILVAYLNNPKQKRPKKWYCGEKKHAIYNTIKMPPHNLIWLKACADIRNTHNELDLHGTWSLSTLNPKNWELVAVEMFWCPESVIGRRVSKGEWNMNGRFIWQRRQQKNQENLFHTFFSG